MSVRRAGRLVACLWLLAVVLLYFELGMLPGLKEFSNGHLLPGLKKLLNGEALLRPGMPAAESVIADIGHLAAAAAVFAAAWGIGRTLVLLVSRNARLALDAGAPLPSFSTVSALGLGVLSVVALAGLFRPVVLWTTVIIGVLAATLHALRSPPRRPPMPQGVVEWVALALIGAAGGFALIGALAPEVEYDALWYHLPFPEAYLTAGSLVDFPCYYTSYYPMGAVLSISK